MSTVDTQTVCFAIRSDQIVDFYSLLSQFRQAKADRQALEDVPRTADIDDAARNDLIELEIEAAAQIVDILTALP